MKSNKYINAWLPILCLIPFLLVEAAVLPSINSAQTVLQSAQTVLQSAQTVLAQTVLQSRSGTSNQIPAVPLAVRSPYLSCWLASGGGGNPNTGGLLAGQSPQFWPIQFDQAQNFPPPSTRKNYNLGWNGLVSINGNSCQFMGAQVATIPSIPLCTQTAFSYTSTTSVFKFTFNGIPFVVTFLSPIEPKDLKRLSLALSYLTIEFAPLDLAANNVMVYTDISGEWASGDPSSTINWSYTNGFYQVQRAQQLQYSEQLQQAEWGKVVYGTTEVLGRSTASGGATLLQTEFVRTGRLSNTQDSNYRPINVDTPTFAFAVPLNAMSPSATFSIGFLQQNLVNFVTPSGLVDLSGLWTTYFPSILSATQFFIGDHANAVQSSRILDSMIETDSINAGGSSGQNYASITSLSVRQAFGALELTVGLNPGDDPIMWMKEISSNGNTNTVDVMFPIHPMLIYLNPVLLKYLVSGIFIYTAAGLWPRKWAIHDLGASFPNATGHNSGENVEQMPVEESGNMIWMTLAYYQQSKDSKFVSKYYSILKDWTSFLITEGIIPEHQLSTDDFAGPLVNQTNLAVKAVVGIAAMSKLSEAVGNTQDQTYYSDFARKAGVQVMSLGQINQNGLVHTKLSYNDDQPSSFSTLYNAFGDRFLNLNILPANTLQLQSEYYPTITGQFGMPLDTRFAWAKTDWQMFASASATSVSTRNLFIDRLASYISDRKNNVGFSDLYDTITGGFPTEASGQIPIRFDSRPVVGGHFSLLALASQDRVNGVSTNHFL